MSQLFDRKCAVTLVKPIKGSFTQTDPKNAIEITDLRMSFTIEKKLQKSPNTAEIVIYNLAAQTRALVQVKPLHVRLIAGYGSDVRVMWTGDMTFSDSKHNGVEWVTTIEVGNGVRAFNYARVNRTFAPSRGGTGTTSMDVIKDIATSMGMGVVVPAELKAQLTQTQNRQSLSVRGPARAALDRILPKGVEWSIQDNQIQLLRKNEPRTNEAWLINESSGMVGTPEYSPPKKPGEKATLNVRTLLHADIIPGHKIKVQSDGINGGVFRVEAIKHRGDTASQEWYSEIEAKPIS